MINSPPGPGQQPSVSTPAPSSTELELLRRQSIRVLGSVATALEAAAHQRQSLLAEVGTARQTLQELLQEREIAATNLAATRAKLDAAATQLHDEVAALERRRDELTVEVEVARPRRRDELTVQVAPPPVVEPAPTLVDAGTAEPRPSVAQPSWHDVIGAVRQRLVMARRIHLGLGQIATGALIALLLGLALLLTPLTQVFGGLELLAVMSGSMEPTIPVGGVVAIRPVSAADLKVGDAITFVNLSNPDVLVTHRIVSIELRDGQTMLTTKGDANDSVDALSAPASRAVGRVEFALPYLGYLMVWLGSPIAKIAIVALAVLGLVLTSVQRTSTPSARPESYSEHEREIQSLLGR